MWTSQALKCPAAGLRWKAGRVPQGGNLGTRLVLLSNAENLSGKTVRHRTDNMNVENILKVGSPCPKLHAEAIAIYNPSGQHNICLEPEWIPRELNIAADALSRQVEYDNYMLNPDIVALDILWGPHAVDQFSTFRRCQIPQFLQSLA